MAYLALARKWRPKSFQEVVGQGHVVKALSNALDSGRVHHAYLFTGTRGVGKTTLARIFAKSLNCETGTSADPCQQCSTCLSVDEGRFVDLIEVDAASRTKVDDTRELLENVQYAPTAGKFKVYLIDEVHMLSGHSFNALLKTLEEPPEHVKFLFATTDPQKLPVTVLSRCLQFNLRAMRPEQVENQLVKILDQEQLDYETPALQALAKAADGSMRDGLSLLDQAIAQSSGPITQAEVASMLGTIKAEHTAALMSALIEQNADAVMQVVTDMADHAVDFAAALDDLLMQLYNVSLAQIAPNALSAKGLDGEQFEAYAASLSPETIQLYYQIGLHSKKDIAHAPSLRVGFEMALLRMLVFEPVEASPAAPNNVAPTGQDKPILPSELRAAAEQQKQVQPPAAKPQAQHPQKNHHPKASANAANQEEPSARTDESIVSEANVANKEEPSARMDESIVSEANAANKEEPSARMDESIVSEANVANKEEPSARTDESVVSEANVANKKQHTPAASKAASVLAGHNEWGELVEQSELIGLTRQLAMNCACERLAEDHVDLALAPKLHHLHKPERIEEITAELKRMSDRDFAVNVSLAASDKETPAECLERLGVEKTSQLKADIEQEPAVQALMSEFGASIVEQSVKPAD